jgi:hypothetical protein
MTTRAALLCLSLLAGLGAATQVVQAGSPGGGKCRAELQAGLATLSLGTAEQAGAVAQRLAREAIAGLAEIARPAPPRPRVAGRGADAGPQDRS